jgi:D-xylose transport system substrate-binding protein
MKGASINPEERPVTGQDATVAGLQRILAGQQFMTVYKEIEPEATISAEIAIALAEGEEVPQEHITGEVENGKGKVPAVELVPIAVTKENVKSTVVAGGFVSASELCTSAYASACKEAGISG